MRSRFQETIAMTMIGDGVLGFVRPKEHCSVWLRGPRSWERAIRWFIKHPQITRSLAIGEMVLGLWWSFRLRPTSGYVQHTSNSPELLAK